MFIRLFSVFKRNSSHSAADTNPCFGCQQGRLLLLRAGRCLSSTGQAAVHPQRRRPTRVLSQALQTHHPASPRPSLVAGRIQFCLCVLAFRCLNGSVPPYLAESVCRTADVEGRRHLRSSTTMTLVVPSLSRQCSDQLLVTAPFLSLHRGHGTAYHLPSELFYPSPFGNNWRHNCLGLVLADFLYPPHCYYDSVKCPASFAWQHHLNQYIGNNNNNNNNYKYSTNTSTMTTTTVTTATTTTTNTTTTTTTTGAKIFYRSYILPVTQPTLLKCWWKTHQYSRTHLNDSI